MDVQFSFSDGGGLPVQHCLSCTFGLLFVDHCRCHSKPEVCGCDERDLGGHSTLPPSHFPVPVSCPLSLPATGTNILFHSSEIMLGFQCLPPK